MQCIARNTSFELLRVLLMIMIIVHHCIVHGLGLSGLSSNFSVTLIIPPEQMIAVFSINAFCICAVNCFILISGYFKIKVEAKKYIYLLLSILFYTVIFTILPYIIIGDYRKAVIKCLFISHSPYWFVIDYLFLMVFVPIINFAFENFTKDKRNLIIIGLLIISCYFGFLWSHVANKNGYTIIQFITMYCIGRQIALDKYKIRCYKSLLYYIIGSLLCAFSGWIYWRIGNNELAWRTTFYNNPFLVISSIGLFMLFQNITFHSNIINRCAKSVFGIYLFQSSISVGYITYDWIRINSVRLFDLGGGIIWVTFLVIAIVTTLIAILFDQIRIKFIKIVQPGVIKIYKKCI